MAEYIQNEYKAKTLIVDSDHANSPTKVKKLIDQLKEKQPEIVIGTSLLCQPCKDYSLDMIIFLNADL